MKSCCKRHALVNDIDSSSQLPSSGWINFSVLKVHNPTSFSIAISEHLDLKGNKTTINHDPLINEKLNDYFQLDENRFLLFFLYDLSCNILLLQGN